MSNTTLALADVLRSGDPHFLASCLVPQGPQTLRRARRIFAKTWRENPRVAFTTSSEGRTFIGGLECRGCTPEWLRTIKTVLRRVQSSRRDWYRLRARVIGFEVMDLEPDTAGEWFNGYQGGTGEAHFMAPGVIQLSRSTKPSAIVVAHECGHAVTTRVEWESREREITDGEWASEGCANRYVLKWGFSEAALRRTVHSQIGHMGGVPGDTITIGNDEEERTYRITQDLHYRIVQRSVLLVPPPAPHRRGGRWARAVGYP